MAQASPRDRRAIELETDFVGREEFVETILEELHGGVRALTLTGPPGIGKTRLAREVAARFSEGAKRETLVVELADVDSVEELVAIVAERLGVPVAGERTVERTAHALDGFDDPFVVLDDVERLVGDELRAVMREWLERAPRSTFLVTSRSRLGAEFEVCRELEPLRTDAAVELFEQRAQRVASGFEVDASNREVVVDLVEAVDGIPLAVKLAAGRVRVLSPGQMLERLDRPLEFLEGARGPGSLRRAIERSWELLSPAERRAFRKLAVFRGTFTMRAAESVVETAEGDPSVVEMVDRLVDHSLLQTSAGEATGEAVRLRMLEPVRRFAHRRLEEADAIDEIRARHARHYRSGCRMLTRQRYDTAYLEWVASLAPEIENLLAAFEWYLEREDPAAGEICNTLGDFFLYRRNLEKVRELVERTRGRVDLEERPALAANLLRSQAEAVAGVEGRDAADRLRREALERVDVDREPRLVCNLWIGVGYSGFVHGFFDESKEALERALDLARTHDFELEEVAVLSVRGRQKREEGDLEGAREMLDRALTIVQGIDAAYQEAKVRINYGSLLQRRGRYEEALELVRRGVDLGEGDDVPHRGTTGPANLACALAMVGDLEEADEQFERAATLLQLRGLRRAQANTLLDHALVLIRRDDLEIARSKLEEVVGLADPDNRAGAFPNLAGAFAALGLVDTLDGRETSARDRFDRARSYVGASPTDHTGRKFERFLDILETAAELVAARSSDADGDAEELRRAIEAIDEETLESFEEKFARRILADYEEDGSGDGGAEGGGEREGTELVIGPEGRWIELEGERLDFSRRGPLRRMVLALAEAHGREDRRALTTYELLERGWPDQEVSPSSGTNRVYTGISRLRDLGFAEILETADDGYRLASGTSVRFRETD